MTIDRVNDINEIDCTVTHWMPLPEPPEEGGTGNAAD
nr:MAG TPA: Protein of unknown function (DUF551) [Caudoviricetes sp.]